MRVVKWVLMGLGGIVVAIAAMGAYVFFDGRSARAEDEAFITAFLTDFSKGWRPEAVDGRMTQDNFRQLASLEGARTLRQLSSLGRVKAIESINMVHHGVSADGKVTAYDFKGVFENGTVSARFVLKKDENGVRVKDMMLQPSSPIRARSDL